MVKTIDSNAIYVVNGEEVPIETTIQNYIFKVGREGYKHAEWLADAASLYVFAPQAKDNAVPANEGKIGEIDVLVEPEQYPTDMVLAQ